MRVTFNEHNLSIIGAFVEHNRKIFGAVQHSIIGIFLSIIGSALISLVSCNVTCACAYGVGMFMYAACSDHFKGYLHKSGTMYSVIKRSLHHHF